jgi:phosphoglycerol transferase
MNSLTRYWRVIVVAAAAALIWIAHYERWTLASWQLPTDYYVDAQETLARLKAASEGNLVPLQPQVIERLGAPFGAHWNAYPTPDKPLMLLLGGIVHAVGLYAAANLGLLLAQVSSALAFYLVARRLRFRWEWAAASALLFACTYSTVHRGLSHFSLVFTWTIPLGLWAVWLVAGSHRLEWKRSGAIACLAAAVALGTSNPYNLLFWLQLMGWAVVVQWLGARRRGNLQIGIASILVALLALFVVQAEGWLFVEDTEAMPLLARNYAGTEMYALKPVEMFIPPAYHAWDWLAFFGHRYLRWSGWRGEAFLPYLGLIGIAGFVWLLFVTVRRIVDRRPLPGQALSVGWILAYASVGGVTNLLALYLGFQVFRATNRGAIFVSAIVLFFLAGRLSRLTAGWPAWVRAGAAALVAGVGVLEQLPRREVASDLKTLAAEVQGDRVFGRRLEQALPRGAKVFQLPVLGFPEVATPHRLGDYEHFRPYLASETLQFSYGSAKGRARGRWQQELEARPVPEMVRRLEEYGFGALYINRKGYADRAEALLRDLEGLGYTQRIEGPIGDQVVVPLRPIPLPRPPLSESMTFGRGWHQRPDAGVRWAHGEAAFSYHNPHLYPISVDVSLTLAGVTPRQVVLEREGEVVRQVSVAREPQTFAIPGIALAPGVNRFTLHSPAKARRDPAALNQLRSFGVRELTVIPRANEPGVPAARSPAPVRAPGARPGVVGAGEARRAAGTGG